jgi:HipA-like protein
MSAARSPWKKLAEQVWDVIASWGGLEHAQPATRPQPGREIRVYLMRDGRRIHVASLTKEHDEYVFEYTREFKDRTDLAPISAFRDLSQPHRAKKLWPFFVVRVPPVEREDVRRTIEELGIAVDDEFALLAAVGGRTITSPYELELREAPLSGSSERPSQLPVAAHS